MSIDSYDLPDDVSDVSLVEISRIKMLDVNSPSAAALVMTFLDTPEKRLLYKRSFNEVDLMRISKEIKMSTAVTVLKKKKK